jgi:hypothetical protein
MFVIVSKEREKLAKQKAFACLLTTGMIWCMETVNEIRGATWIAFLLERGGYKSLAELHEALDLVGSVQSWSQYKAGVSPQESTVRLVDKAVPGSASLFLNGPLGLPLWAVLEGDIAVCQRVVSDLLNGYVEPEPWMSVARRSVASMGDSDRLKALLEIVLPRSLWQPPTGSVRFNPNEPHKMELVGWLSLFELFERAENPLATQYVADKLKAGEENIIKHAVLGFISKLTGKHAFTDRSKDNLTNANYVLGFIALVQIANESRDKNLMNAPAFLKIGIKQAVADTFSSDVALFLETL